MNIIEILTANADEVGDGIDEKRVRDLEARLNIVLPTDFALYLENLNYATLFDDEIYGINSECESIDLYKRNKHKEHFKYGFLEIFSSDIDGTIYLRPDTGAIYNASFMCPIADSFTAFVSMVVSEA